MSEALDHEAPEPPEAGETVHHLAEPQDPLLLQWAKFRPQFQEAMSAGFWTIEDLEQKIAHRRAFFFPGKDAAMVTEIVAYPGGERVMQALWACGNVEELLAMAPGIEAIARMQGCTSVIIEGRKAWAKVLAPHGYDEWSVTLRKAL